MRNHDTMGWYEGQIWSLHNDAEGQRIAYDSFEIARAICYHFEDESAALAVEIPADGSGMTKWNFNTAMWENK